MSKKQRNKKLILQNKRNRIINKRYSSTIKTLFKLLLLKTKKLSKFSSIEEENAFVLVRKNEVTKIVNMLFSIIDKAMKKNVIHRNTAARKKSKVSKISAKL